MQHLQALRGLVDHHVDDLRRAAEVIGKRRHVRVQAAEQEPAVGLEPRHLRQVVRAFGFELLRITRPPWVLDLEQLAVVAERPAVERAGERRTVVLLAPTQHRTLVAAGVDQRVQLAVLIPGDHDGLTAHVDGQVVVVVRQLALMGQVDPVALEDVLHLQLEDLRVRERVPPVAIHTPLGVVHQRAVDLLPDLVQRDRHLCGPPMTRARRGVPIGRSPVSPCGIRRVAACRGRACGRGPDVGWHDQHGLPASVSH